MLLWMTGIAMCNTTMGNLGLRHRLAMVSGELAVLIMGPFAAADGLRLLVGNFDILHIRGMPDLMVEKINFDL